MATEFTQKREPIFLNDPMVTYNHMDEDAVASNYNQQNKNTRILWTVVAEEALIASLMLMLLWTSLG